MSSFWKKTIVQFKPLFFFIVLFFFPNVLMSCCASLVRVVIFVKGLGVFYISFHSGVRCIWWYKMIFLVLNLAEHRATHSSLPWKTNGVHLCCSTAVLVPTFLFKLCFILIFPHAMTITQFQFAMGKVIEYYRMETVQFCFC